MSNLNDGTKLVLSEVRALTTAVAGMARQLDRVDGRLGDVEGHVVTVQRQVTEMKQQTDLIPAIADAVRGLVGDIDDHEARLKRLEKAVA